MGGSQGKLTTSYTKGSPVQHTDEQLDPPFQTVPECIHYYASSQPDEDALVFYSTDAPRYTVSWRDLYERSLRIANAFRHQGVQAGETVAIVSRSCPEWYYVFIGVMMLRAKVITTTVTYKDGSDVIHLMKKLGTCSVFVLDPGLNDSNWTVVKQLVDDLQLDGRVSSSRMPYLRKLIFMCQPMDHQGNTIANLIDEYIPIDQVDIEYMQPDDIAIFYQTSGTTGTPKLVAHSNANFLKLLKIDKAYGVYGGKRHFNDRPFFWMSGFIWEFMLGCTRVTLSDMCPAPEDYIALVIQAIQVERCTETILIPHTIYELMKRERDIPADWPLKTILTGSQPTTRSIASCIGPLCKRLCVLYASTEPNIITAFLVENAAEYVDYASGLAPNGCEVKVVDDDGSIVPVGERGEIYVKSDWMFKEYYNDTEKTVAAKSSDGWYKTDDYGKINEDGYLFVEGRISDIIICGGKNVAPSMLEAVLKSFPGVETTAIVPVPDDELFQAICACVQIKQGSDVINADLRVYMEKMHTDKQNLFIALPKYYMILDQFPIERTGKISRKTLKLMAEEKFHTEQNHGGTLIL